MSNKVILTLVLLAFRLLASRAEKYGCDFETSCGDILVDRYWGLTSADIPFAANAPDHDHTYDNSSGHYIFFNLNGGGSSFQDSFLKFNNIFNFSKLNTSSGGGKQQCLQFYYIIEADQSKNLTVRLVMGDNGDLQPVWLTVNTFENKSSDWTLAEVRLPNDSFYIWLVFNFNSNPLPNILFVLDDIFVDECHLQSNETIEKETISREENTVLFWCDFEKDDCSFENTMKTDWNRIEASDHPDYGPDKDHTFNSENGHYLVSSLTTSLHIGQVQRVVSERITVPDDGTPYCLSFYYYLDRYGSVLVTAIPLNDSSSNVTFKLNHQIWPVGTSSNFYITKRWAWAIASLLPGTFKLSFMITNRENSFLKASLDDIKIHSCPAVNNPVTAYNPYTSFYFEFECNFEKDRCGFSETNDRITNLRDEVPSYWDLINAHQNLYPSLGPANDHTTGKSDGHYLTVNFTGPLSFSFNALTATQPLFSHSDMCIEFFYYMNSELYTVSSKSLFALQAGGCYGAYLFYINPFFPNITVPEWTRVVSRVLDYPCRELFYFAFNLGDLIKMSVSIDDVRIDRCDKIDPPATTTTATTTTTTPTTTTKTTPSASTTTTTTTLYSSTTETTTTVIVTTITDSTITMQITTTPSSSSNLKFKPYILFAIFFFFAIFSNY